MGNPLGQAFRLYRRNFALIVAVVLTVMPAMWAYNWVFIPPGSQGSWWSIPSHVGTLLSIALVSLSNAAIIYALAESRKGRQAGYLDAMRTGLRIWSGLFLVNLVTTLLIVLGFALLIVPGIIITLRYFLASPVAVLEAAGVPRALRRSAALTRGRRWEMFVYSLVLGLIVFMPCGLALWALRSSTSTAGLVARMLIRCVQDIAIVMMTALTVVFYFEQRDAENHAETPDAGEVAPTPAAGPSAI